MDYPVRKNNKGQLIAYIHGRWRRAGRKECFYCGADFFYDIHRTDRSRKFCSPICNGKENSKRLRRKQLTKRCTICSNTFKIRQSHAKLRKTCGNPYCGREQRNRSIRLHYNGNPGITHGISNTYRNGCRCQLCRDKINEINRERRRAKRQAIMNG